MSTYDEHGWVKSFYVEPGDQHVIMTVHNPDEGQDVTVRVAKTELGTMADAHFFYSDGPPQTPTPMPARSQGQETRS